jgi:hypothetical protein
VRAAGLLCAVLAAACGVAAPDAAPPGPCLTLVPGLRVEGACGGTLRVVLDEHELPPDPRELSVDGARVLPWPSWARDGMPSTAGYDGGPQTSFAATPYLCQVVTVSCP